MSAAVSAAPIEEIKARLDIAEVIGEYISLKPSGPERLKARCPFHSEKTPSFMVSRDRQIFHCFGCGEGGDVFTFVQKMEGLEFPEALRLLAQKANVELPSYDPKLSSERTAILEALDLATSYFHEFLLHAKAAEGARKYFQEKRGLTSATIEQFKIGYAPDAWDGLAQALRKRKVTDTHLVTSGLAIKREKGSGLYDRFRNRLMFPIRDPHGATIGFGGRALDPNEPAKYINTPQTLVYNKSTVLYGLDLAKSEIRKQKQVVVVEGYMDCVTSHQAGITNVVASSGTALTEGQVLLLKRYAPIASLAFDMDPAGETAAKRGIAVAWREGLDVKVVSLPYGKDPDECIRHNVQDWRDAIAQAQPILDFYFSRTLDTRDRSKVQDKKDAAKILLPIVAQVANPVEQTHYLQKLSQWLQVDEMILRKQLLPKSERAKLKELTPASVDRCELLSQQLLGLLVIEPSAMPTIKERLPVEAFAPGVWQGLYKIYLSQYSETHQTQRETWRPTIAERDAGLADAFAVANLAASTFEGSTAVERHREIESIAEAMQGLWLRRELEQLTLALKQAEAKKDTAMVRELSRRFDELTAKFK
jgi:DNA primase